MCQHNFAPCCAPVIGSLASRYYRDGRAGIERAGSFPLVAVPAEQALTKLWPGPFSATFWKGRCEASEVAAWLSEIDRQCLFCRNPQTYTSSIHAYRCRLVTAQLRSKSPQRTSTPLVPSRGAPARAKRDVGALRLSIGEVPRLAARPRVPPKRTMRIGNCACFSSGKKRGRQGDPSRPRGRKYWRFWV
jgi:hypothetical protein